jgi:hypothetical protein
LNLQPLPDRPTWLTVEPVIKISAPNPGVFWLGWLLAVDQIQPQKLNLRACHLLLLKSFEIRTSKNKAVKINQFQSTIRCVLFRTGKSPRLNV